MLLIAAGLILGLFREARSTSDIAFVDPATTVETSKDFTADFRITSGQYVPMTTVEAIIEKKNADFADARGKTVVTRAECEPDLKTASSSCTLTKSGSTSTGVSAIKFVNAFGVEAGVSPSSAYVLTDGMEDFGYQCNSTTGPCTFSDSGYGYDTGGAPTDGSPEFDENGFGYGYGYKFGTAHAIVTTSHTDYGYGYTTNGYDLVLRFTITVSGDALGSGTFYLTFIAHTSSATVTTISSPFAEFTSAPPGGGSGSTGGGGTDLTAAGETQTINASPVTPPAGATAAYVATIASAAVNNNVKIITGDPTFPEITLNIGTAITASTTVNIVVWPGTATPTGTTALPGGVTGGHFLTLTVGTGADPVNTMSMKIHMAEAAVTNALQALLMHYLNNAWNPEAALTLTKVGAFYDATVSGISCCSVFAVAFDTQNPTVTLGALTGDQKGTVKLTATASDNVKVTKVEFYVDNVLKGTDTASPYEYSFDTTSVSNGAHTVKAVAYDFVNNKGDNSGSMSVNNVAGGEPGGKGGAGNIWIWVVVGLVIVAIVIFAVVQMGKKK